MNFSPTWRQKLERQCRTASVIRYSMGNKVIIIFINLTGQNRGLSGLKNIWPVIMTGDLLSVILSLGFQLCSLLLGGEKKGVNNFSKLYPYMFGKKKHKAKEAGYWPISLTETKLRSIKLYAKKNESNNQAKKRTFSCGKSRGARLAHLDHSSSQSECRICLILPTCGFSHTIIRRRTRTIIYLLFVFASLCSLASL